MLVDGEPLSCTTYALEAPPSGRGRGVAVVSLDRVGARNAFSLRMHRELDMLFDRACADPSVGAVVLRANGDHFSSGHDLGTAEQLAQLQAADYGERFGGEVEGMFQKWSELDVEMCLRWRQLPKPLICGIKGYTIYHATAVVGVCDVVLCDETLRFMPGLLEMNSLLFDVGFSAKRAKELLMTQRFVLAPEALDLGLVNRVVASGELDEALLQLARVVARGDPFQLRMAKRAINQAQDGAGLSTAARASLSEWSAFRWSWSEQQKAREGSALTADHGGKAKTLAPVAHANSEAVMRLSRLASGLAPGSKL